MNARLRWLRDKLNALNIQGMIISNPTNIKYLTNINAEGELLITRKENIYITDGRYVEEVNMALTIDDEVIVHDRRSLTKDDYENFFMFCEDVGFEETYVTFENYKKIKQMYKINDLVETEQIIEKQRVIKDEEEIAKITKACEITDECFSYLLKHIKKGMTEKQIANEIEYYMKKHGAEGVSFEPIVASGPNSSKPHSIPTDRKIQSGDIIIIDLGCKYEGYSSDMTRTVFMDYVPEEVKKYYDLVLKNQNNALNDCRENSNIKTITRMVESDFNVNDMNLIHALGHGVGMEVHEIPVISMKTDSTLKENMVLAIEPGLYMPGKFGIRIEDTILITKNNCIKLTKSEKNYTIIS